MSINYGSYEWFEKAGATKSFLGNAWGTKWKAYTKIRYDKYIKISKKYLNKGNMDILDIGCAEGDFCKKVYKINHSNRISVCDCVPSMIKKVKYKYPLFDAKICDVNKLSSVYRKKFDLVYCLGVLQYCENINKALIEISSVLNKDGRAIIENPYSNIKYNEIKKGIKKYYEIEKVEYEYGGWYTHFFQTFWRESFQLEHPSKIKWIATVIILGNYPLALLFEYMAKKYGKGRHRIFGEILVLKSKFMKKVV